LISEAPPKTRIDLVREFLPSPVLPTSNPVEDNSLEVHALSDLESLYSTVRKWKRSGEEMFDGQTCSKDDVYVYFRDIRRQTAAENPQSQFLPGLNRYFRELRRLWREDPAIALRIKGERMKAKLTRQPEYFLTENSIVFLHTSNGEDSDDIPLEEKLQSQRLLLADNDNGIGIGAGVS
jgi:hypothetical protein